MKKSLYAIAASLLLLCSCEDLLDRPALTTVVDNNFWRGEGDVRLYVNGFYPLYFEGYGVDWSQEFAPVRGGTSFCDDFTSEGTQSRFENKVPTSRGSSSESRSCFEQYYGPSWGFARIHKVNILIDRLNEYKDNFTEEEYNHWMAIAYFFKIYEYSDLVGVFGDVPYFETTVRDLDFDTQYKDRDSRQLVMDKVYDMCEFVLENMRPDDGANNVNLYVAAAFISRFMLYEGTWQKYHDGEEGCDGKVNCDSEHAKKYLEMAVKAAEVVMNSGKYSFGSSFKDLFVSENLAGNPEVLLYRHYDEALQVRHPIGSYNGGSDSGSNVNLEYIKAFNCQDGKPWSISSTPGADDFSVANLVKTRDPRFFDTFWNQVNIKSNTMIYCYKFASYEALDHFYKTGDKLANWQGIYNTNDCPIMRLAEVVLNWIEAKAELAQSFGGPAVTQADIDKSINAIRDRPLSAAAEKAGVKKTAHLQIASIPKDPKRDSDVPALIWEIRRERRMEFLHEGNRIKDLLRWYKLDYMDYDTDPDKYLGPWVDFPKEAGTEAGTPEVNKNFMNARIGVLQVQRADGSVVKYNGANADQMVGFYCVRNASNRETFFDRSYMAPVGQQQIDEYKMRGYHLSQTVNW
ncbi:MAG: RagB/SusD family nutrient uptake outer membrane protein [Bacteroidales bacterium]|nr:RagB/SusD family nutrient uptake outer membrane protein [Bacteroidales bacterium]